MNWSAEELRRLSLFIAKAQQAGLSDVHICPSQNGTELKVRKGGSIQVCQTLDPENGKTLVQRIKAQANLNIAESRIAQDGRLPAHPPLHREVRVATHPTLHGENMVLRLFGEQRLRAIDHLGIGPRTQQRLIEGLDTDEGLILVCGPTGAGKTTTLHALLNQINPVTTNIMTLEDPVEILLPGANQTDLSQLPRMNFSQGLKSLLRQDPDVIMVGEIRDRETAELAIEAAMTGHLVMASLHAADTLGALARLDMLGIGIRRVLPHLRNLICQRLAFQKNQAETRRTPLMQIWNPLRHPSAIRHTWAVLTDVAPHLHSPAVWTFQECASEAMDAGLLSPLECPAWAAIA